MAYNGKDLEILKDIIGRLHLPAEILLSDGRKGWIRCTTEPQYREGSGCPTAMVDVNFENEDFGYEITLAEHGAAVLSPEPKLEPKQ